ncbi:MAG: hypothetical protein L0241_20550 [Planctomycetia bacterium]|nr:hypothetical protein [Planctomycetia bacterium]
MIFPFLDLNLINTVTNTPIRQRPRPFIPLYIAGPNGRLIKFDALVDSGADEVLLPDSFLAALGFTPGSGVIRGTTGIGGRGQTVYQSVRLELRAAANDRVIWNSMIGFTPLPLQICLFGIAGGLEFFHTSLNIIDRHVVLFPHAMMPLVPPSSTPHVSFPIP